MRILTVRQPWAWAIIHAGKDVENRTRNLAGDYRGPVAIHAGLADFEQGNLAAQKHKLAYGTSTPTEMVFGAIIGVVDLVGMHTGDSPSDDRFEHVGSCFRPGKPYGPCSEWAEPYVKHLELANPRPLREPLPYRGALHLQTPTAADATEILRRAT